jgi:hypothetical protein
MKVVIKKRAFNTITKTAEWLEHQNTSGASERWLDKVYDFVESYAKKNVQYAICQNEKLAKWMYSCITYQDNWVIAFKSSNDAFVVCRFVHASRLR